MHSEFDVFDAFWPVMAISVPAAVLVHVLLRAKFITALLLGGAMVAVAHSFGWTHSPVSLIGYAEFGAMFLLLCHGLDLNVTKLRQSWRSFLVVGVVQLGLTVALGMLAAPIVVPNCTIEKALLVGLIMATSSPAVMFFELRDREAEHSPEGQLAGQLSIAHDLFLPVCALLILAIAPNNGEHPKEFSPIFIGIAVITGVLIVEWVISARALDWAGKRLHPVVFLMCLVTLVLGMAMASRRAQLSPAFGCFLAGVVIARTLFRNTIRGWASLPRDLSLGIFFILVGTMIDVEILLKHWDRILLSLLGMVAIKFVTAAFAGLVVGLTYREAIRLGGYLANIGEASFVVGLLGYHHGIIDRIDAQVMVALSVLTLGLNPTVNRITHRLQRYVPDIRMRWQDTRLLAWLSSKTVLKLEGDFVVVVGCDRVGTEILRLLIKLGMQVVVLEQNSATYHAAQDYLAKLKREASETPETKLPEVHILYNDAGNHHTWKIINGNAARLVVVTFGSVDLVAAIASHLEQAPEPKPAIVVRTRERELKVDIAAVAPGCKVYADDDDGIHPFLAVLSDEVGRITHPAVPPDSRNGKPDAPLAGVLPGQTS